MLRTRKFLTLSVVLVAAFLSRSGVAEMGGKPKPRLVQFVGVDISGSFLKGRYFDDGIAFLARYLKAHLDGEGGFDVPAALFVGSLGGANAGEPKTFFPIQTFENLSTAQIEAKLHELFPKSKSNPFTDYNAFFEQVAATVKDKNLVLKPISVVMISDGLPDVPGSEKGYRAIKVSPLETLSRNVTLRVLYTSAPVAQGWKQKVPRKRVKVWTQDATVMVGWRGNGRAPSSESERYTAWIRDNVDFPVRAHRVD